MIRYSEQSIDENDIFQVSSALASPFLTQGPEIEKFEMEVAEFCSSASATAVSSATAGLHLAYLAVDLKKGDLVWTVGNSFVATASAAKYCGAEVDFVDINKNTYNICVVSLEQKILSSSRKPDVLCVVHFAGRPSPMKEISNICQKHSIKIIEDASHSFGAKYENEFVGACTYSEAVIFSFHPVKILTTAEGGVICTNKDEITKKVRRLRSHGITRDVAIPWYPQQEEIGFNYRMTEPQAALGRAQLKKLQSFFEHRTELAEYYNKHLASLPLKTPLYDDDAFVSSKHLYVIMLNKKSEKYRNEFIRYLLDHDIGANLHYYPIYKFPNFKTNSEFYPNNEEYFRSAITIPLSTKLSRDQQIYIIDTMKQFLDD